MNSPDVTAILRLLSDKSRIRILDVLLDGRAYSVNEITTFTKIKQHTVSYHLKLLTEGNLTAVKQYGKFRYYFISDTITPQLLEILSSFSPEEPTRSLNQYVAKKELKQARTCYDHIAGELGVKIRGFLTSRNMLAADQDHLDSYVLTAEGEKYFKENLSIDVDALKKKKRKFCINCLDWSERKNHIAGSVGKAILDFLEQNKYITRSPGSRAVKITNAGRAFLKKEWHIVLSGE